MICVYNNQSTGQHWLLKWLCCQTRVEVLLFRDFIALPVNKLPSWNSKITNFICWKKTAQAEVKQIGFRQVSKRFSKVSDDLIPHLKLCAILSWLEIDVRDSGSHHSFSRPSNQSHFFFHQLLLHELPFWGVNSIRFPSSFNLSKNEAGCLWDLDFDQNKGWIITQTPNKIVTLPTLAHYHHDYTVHPYTFSSTSCQNLHTTE